MVREHDVPARDRHRILRPGRGSGHAQREAQGVALVPRHARVLDAAQLVRGGGRHVHEPHDPAVGRVGVLGEAVLGPAHLLEEQEIASPEVLMEVSHEVRGGRAAGDAAVAVAPGVQLDLVQLRSESGVLEGLEDRARLLERLRLQPRGKTWRMWRRVRVERVVDAREDLRSLRQNPVGPGHHAHLHEGACAHAVVHPVVDQQGVPADRGPAAGGLEELLVRHGVLVVAQLVAHVREQLQERDAEVRLVALGPLGDTGGHEVQKRLAEARVVLGEVVDQRLGDLLGRALVVGPAVEAARAAGLEGEVHARVWRVEHGVLDVQRVRGEVAGLAHIHAQVIALLRHRRHADLPDALPAGHAHGRGVPVELVQQRGQACWDWSGRPCL